MHYDNLSLIYENKFNQSVIREDSINQYKYYFERNNQEKLNFLIENVLNQGELQYLAEAGLLRNLGNKFKKGLATAGVAAAMLGGGNNANAQQPQQSTSNKPAITQSAYQIDGESVDINKHVDEFVRSLNQTLKQKASQLWKQIKNPQVQQKEVNNYRQLIKVANELMQDGGSAEEIIQKYREVLAPFINIDQFAQAFVEELPDPFQQHHYLYGSPKIR
jgi:hypothetical protein